MKRNDKCQKFVIRNKNNRDIVSKLETLQTDLGDYCHTHKPNLRLEVKTKNGEPYKYQYYKILNDDDVEVESEIESKDKDADEDNIYFAMKDIWNTINSILRERDEYRAERKKERKEKLIEKKELNNNKNSNDKEIINNEIRENSDDNNCESNMKQYTIEVCDVSRDLLSKK
eukprot:UN13324